MNGGTTNPNVLANGVKGSSMPMLARDKQVADSHLLGRLKKNGLRYVLMRKTTRISVAMDSMNQPVWNNGPLA